MAMRWTVLLLIIVVLSYIESPHGTTPNVLPTPVMTIQPTQTASPQHPSRVRRAPRADSR